MHTQHTQHTPKTTHTTAQGPTTQKQFAVGNQDFGTRAYKTQGKRETRKRVWKANTNGFALSLLGEP